MKPAGQFQGLLPSVVDRLIDPESSSGAGRLGYTIEQMTQAVRRDLEELLNTRQTSSGIPADYPETLRSVVGYGLPDFSVVDASTSEDRTVIGRTIEGIIGLYEPRLRNVRVTLRDEAGTNERTVKFHIEARLAVDPAPEVEFETVLELMSGRTSVEFTGGLV